MEDNHKIETDSRILSNFIPNVEVCYLLKHYKIIVLNFLPTFCAKELTVFLLRNFISDKNEHVLCINLAVT